MRPPIVRACDGPVWFAPHRAKTKATATARWERVDQDEPFSARRRGGKNRAVASGLLTFAKARAQW